MGNHLKEIREGRRISLDLLSRKTGISIEILANLEENRVPELPSKYIVRIVDALGIEVEDLFA